MSLKKLKKKVSELELGRVADILRITEIDNWIKLMEKRWKKRVQRRDLLSLYKWIKDIYGKFEVYGEKIEKLEKRIEKLEKNFNSE